MERRIDALYCTRASAGERIRGVIAEVQNRANAARQEVVTAISERVAALQERQVELIGQIDKVAREKVLALEKQLKAIEAGTCPPAPPEDPDEQPDPDSFILCADSIISFKFGESDFKEKIPEFGVIGEASTYASRSYAKGPALGVLKVDNPSYLWIYACGRDGVRRAEGGDTVVATLSKPGAFDNVAVEDMKDGRYKVTLTPLAAGSYTLDITAGPEGAAERIQGGPFAIEVREPTDYKRLAPDTEPEGKAKVGGEGVGELHEIGCVHHPSGLDFDHTGRFYFVADQSNHRVQAFSAEDHTPLAFFGQKGHGPQDFDSPGDVVAEAPWKHGERELRLVVTDLLNHRLQVIKFNNKTLELSHVRSVGCRGEGEGEFQFPKGLALSEHGHVLVCDSGNHRIQEFDMLDEFKFVRQFGLKGTGEAQFTSPLDVAVNCAGEILVSDSCHRIQVFDHEGNFLRAFGSKGRQPGQFDHPTNMAVNDENALFVCDQSNHRVQVLNASTGTPLHLWKGSKKKKAEGDDAPADDEAEEAGDKPPEWIGVGSPAGIAVNTHGMVVVSDYLNNAVFAF
uniref:Uncharacterized protein n=1 Tax=Pyrodinium bahamense TaxID=73915 RepID=A0A7S0FJ51_9DINO